MQHNSVGRAIPVTTALLQPTWWEGDSPPAAKPNTLPKSVASPMSAVMAAIQALDDRRRPMPIALIAHADEGAVVGLEGHAHVEL